MRYEKTLIISKQEAEQINKHLHDEPACEDECLGEDITIINTAVFDNGIEMDIKCCGVQYDENSESNTAWTEAVLFQNGSEICCTEPSDEYLGEWILEYNEDEYVVIVTDCIYTPRFCNVHIEEVFGNKDEARKNGYTEPTYYKGDYDVLGKSIGTNKMIFAAVKK